MQEGECKLSANALFKADRHKLGNADLFHSHTVHSARRFHSAFVVGDDDELGAGRHGNHFSGETTDVRLVERRVNFVEEAERRGTIMKNSQNQGERSHRLFTTGKQQHVLQTLAGRLRNDVNA
jgi:hypothetical protein